MSGGNGLGIPTGVVFNYAGLNEPAGWLVCDGRAVSRVLYSKLFQVIGTQYGAGDGINTFNLPDYRGKFLRSEVNVADFIFNPANVDVANNRINYTNHPYSTGFKLRFFGQGMMGGVTLNVTYYVIKSGDNHFRLAASYTDASNNNPIVISSAGTGSNFVARQWEDPDTVDTLSSLTIPSGNVNVTTDIITFTNHKLLTGMRIMLQGSIPGGTIPEFSYWIVRLSPDTFGIATTPANANTGTLVNLTSTGSNFVLVNKTHQTPRQNKVQQDAMSSHHHRFFASQGTADGGCCAAGTALSTFGNLSSWDNVREATSAGQDGDGLDVSTETRPVNVSVKFIIKV